MTREYLNRLQYLKAEIKSGIHRLEAMEKREKTVANFGHGVARSLRKYDPVDHREKTMLIDTIQTKQKEYLSLRAELEKEISKIPDHYLRVVLSLIYVDCMTSKEAAAALGGSCTSGGIIQLLVRYFEGAGANDNTGT